MPGTVNDFISRFGAQNTMDDQEASHYADRFASTHEGDSEFDNQTYHAGATEYLGTLPDDQFHGAARNAYSQTPAPQRAGLIGGLLGALQGKGLQPAGLASSLGLGSADPQRMNADDYARLANYTRREHPDALQQTIQQQPTLLKAMGHPVLMGALGMVASKMMRNRAQPAGLFG